MSWVKIYYRDKSKNEIRYLLSYERSYSIIWLKCDTVLYEWDDRWRQIEVRCMNNEASTETRWFWCLSIFYFSSGKNKKHRFLLCVKRILLLHIKIIRNVSLWLLSLLALGLLLSLFFTGGRYPYCFFDEKQKMNGNRGTSTCALFVLFFCAQFSM